MHILFFISLLFFSGCGLDGEITLTKDEYEISDITQPTVLSVTPPPEAKEVRMDASVKVTFSKSIEPESVNESSFYLMSKNGRASGTYIFSTDLKEVIFVPDNLEPLTVYTLTINSRVCDRAGNPLADQDPNDKLPATPFISVFTTTGRDEEE